MFGIGKHQVCPEEHCWHTQLNFQIRMQSIIKFHVIFESNFMFLQGNRGMPNLHVGMWVMFFHTPFIIIQCTIILRLKPKPLKRYSKVKIGWSQKLPKFSKKLVDFEQWFSKYQSYLLFLIEHINPYHLIILNISHFVCID